MSHIDLGALLAALAVALFCVGLGVLAVFRRRRARRARREGFEARWGQAVERLRGMDGIAALWKLRPLTGNAYPVSDRTWRDLDLDAVFARIDRCVSPIGQQVLYRRLRTPRLDLEPLLALERRVLALEAAPESRASLAEALSALSDAGSQSLAQIIFGPPMVLPRGAVFFPLATLATIATALLSIAHPWLLSVVLVLVLGNIAIRLLVFRELSAHVEGLRQVANLVDAARSLVAVESPALAHQIGGLRRALSRLGSRRITLAWLTLDRLRLSDMAGIVIEYANVLLLLDVNAWVSELRFARRQRETLAALFHGVGEIDEALSIASYRAGLSEWARPQLGAGAKTFDVRGLCHPLLDDAVANDASLGRQSVLVTGSNMAGKSTYLKAVGLQAILAQTLFISTARAYIAPFVRLQTLVDVSDDLLSARSHFLVEAETARTMLETSRAFDGCLCIVDELFRGTNTADRIAAGAAFLRALHNAGAHVLAATHDAELLALLREEFAPHYFSEHITSGELAFDYRLRAGPAAPRNALAVLQLVGFPEDVLADARALGGGG
jgi:hypothetical protein